MANASPGTVDVHHHFYPDILMRARPAAPLAGDWTDYKAQFLQPTYTGGTIAEGVASSTRDLLNNLAPCEQSNRGMTMGRGRGLPFDHVSVVHVRNGSVARDRAIRPVAWPISIASLASSGRALSVRARNRRHAGRSRGQSATIAQRHRVRTCIIAVRPASRYRAKEQRPRRDKGHEAGTVSRRRGGVAWRDQG